MGWREVAPYGLVRTTSKTSRLLFLIGTKCPIQHGKQGHVYPIGFSDEGTKICLGSLHMFSVAEPGGGV
jgi:hypothetical protein